jgi:hypothetical protein
VCRVHWYTVEQQSGSEWPCQGGGCGECVRVHWYTLSKQSCNACQALWPGVAENPLLTYSEADPDVIQYVHLSN